MAVEYATHYAGIEKDLVGLLQKTAHLLTLADLAEATEYLAAREYGLALEQIVGGLLDRPEGFPFVLAEHITELARAMKIENRPFMRAMKA